MKWLLILAAQIGLFLILLAACVECQGQEQSRPKWLRPAQGTFLALQAADAGLTEAGFQRTTPKWQEHNPLVPGSTAGRMGYFGATGAFVCLSSEMLARHGHRRWALAGLVVAIGVELYGVTTSAPGLAVTQRRLP